MSLEEIVRELKDRQDILDVVTRYCRGVDRLDRELLVSCYHPEALDDHIVFIGDREEFADWVTQLHTQHQTSTHHSISNHTCDLDGDVAHTETYYVYSGVNRDGSPVTKAGGRYIDRFERRDGQWAIAARKTLLDWEGTPDDKVFTSRERVEDEASEDEASRDRSDPSYLRPLDITSTTPAYRSNL